ncbi:uncharacterized protein LOC135487919 [Lineus longissimus]|uniref:uncharacterized protein LOC135487919 n=1 Tax=Lineus longissimus TaxID=88925 RepID=UPI002B4D446C
MADDKTGLLSGGNKSSVPSSPSAGPSDDALYHDSGQTPRAKLLQIGFVVLTGFMVGLSIILSIVRGAQLRQNGGLYFMLGISLIGFVVIEVLMVIFIRKGDLPKSKTWFVYFIGLCVILEAIFTDVLLYQ